jgi:adenylate kinase
LVFDGFPRTLPQAQALEPVLKQCGFDKPLVIDIHVDDNVLVGRLSGRWMCSVGGEIYNVYDAPPKSPGICDFDGGKLVQRLDDRPEVVKERLRAYHGLTEPLADHYRRQGLLETVDGSASVEQVSNAIAKIIEHVRGRDGHL